MNNNQVSLKVREQISAMLDGELSVHEEELLLARLATDKVLQETFERYQMIHDLMSNQMPSKFDPGFADRVHASIEQESAHNIKAVPSAWQSKIIKPLAAIAVAATVAIVILFSPGRDTSLPGTGNDHIGAIAAADKTYVADPMRWSTSTREVGDNLNSYLVNHNEYTSSTNIQGMLQYVRIAGYDVEQK